MASTEEIAQMSLVELQDRKAVLLGAIERTEAWSTLETLTKGDMLIAFRQELELVEQAIARFQPRLVPG
jgi:isocitrate/isopropylmalate dehydrogenase